VLAKLATGNRYRAWLALQRQKHRRQARKASPMVIGALEDLSGLLVEFRAESSSMTFLATDIVTWSSVAGSEPMTLTTSGDGDGSPVLMLNALGAGHPGVYFQAGEMTGSMDWSLADLTAIWVGNLDLANQGGRWAPRWLSLWNAALGGMDWNTTDGWIVGCYDWVYATNGFVADRNWARPIDLYLDPAQNYVIVTRKQAGTITAWLRPFGNAVVTASGPTVNVGLTVDTLGVGGSSAWEGGLYGVIGHAGFWDRALTETEVLAAMNYLGGLYE
jgi:hypothetical protein